MALSNWDALALDEQNRPTHGVFITPLGVTLRIRKNWLYVEDESAWKEGGVFVEPVVMEIQHGVVIYKDLHIHAIRGPKEGVYFVAYWIRYGDRGIKEKQGAMVGIGCYGFNDSEWVGIGEEEVKFLRAFMDSGEEYEVRTGPETWEKFFAYEFEEFIRKIDLSKAIRFNQGDDYFAAHFNEATPATEPGAAELPILSRLVRGVR